MSACEVRNMWRFTCFVFIYITVTNADPSVNFDYPNIKAEIYEQPVNFMGPAKIAHDKQQPADILNKDAQGPAVDDPWMPYDFSKFDAFVNQHSSDADHNRIKRKAKRRRGSRRRGRQRITTNVPEDVQQRQNQTSTQQPSGRRAGNWETQHSKSRKEGKPRNRYDTYEPPVKEWESGFVEMPKDLYQAHLRPGVIFRIHMAEAILKMQYRNYGEDKDESVIEADVEYLRLTRKVINDEITKFEDLKWLVGWFNNRTDLVQEHTCNVRYFAVGTPPTMFTHVEEYMKRMCLFDNVYIDHIPYVVGEDGSLMAAVAPPVLHCDAATCTSVPFIDSVMFDERLGRTNVRTMTRCQASCRAHCRNDPDCLKRCSDRCLRED